MSDFSTRNVTPLEVVGYFLATLVIGFVAGVGLSLLKHWIAEGDVGLDLTIPAMVAIMSGVCFVAWASQVGLGARRPAHRRARIRR